MFHAHPVPFSGTLWRIQGPNEFVCHVTSDKEKDNLLRLLNANIDVPKPFAYTVVYHQSEELARNNGEPMHGLVYGDGGREPLMATKRDQAVAVLNNLKEYNATISGIEYHLYALVRESN